MGGPVYQPATSTRTGLMPAADKVKLDALPTGGDLTAALALKADAADLGTAAAADIGEAEGNVPVLGSGGKLSEAVLPAIAITNASAVASEAAMLALTAETGDIAIRSDINKTFVLTASPASTLSNWLELRTPTDAVLSVAGKTGAVTLVQSDVSGLVAALAGKLPLTGGTMTGPIDMGGQDVANVNYFGVGAVDASDVSANTVASASAAIGSIADVEAAILARQLTSEKGQPNGYAGLDANAALAVQEVSVRRGTAATINAIVLAEGELAYATDTVSFRVGDGAVAGGISHGSPVVVEVDGSAGGVITLPPRDGWHVLYRVVGVVSNVTVALPGTAPFGQKISICLIVASGPADVKLRWVDNGASGVVGRIGESGMFDGETDSGVLGGLNSGAFIHYWNFLALGYLGSHLWLMLPDSTMTSAEWAAWVANGPA